MPKQSYHIGHCEQRIEGSVKYPTLIGLENTVKLHGRFDATRANQSKQVEDVERSAIPHELGEPPHAAPFLDRWGRLWRS